MKQHTKMKQKWILGLIAGLLPASFAAWNPGGPARQEERTLTFAEQMLAAFHIDEPQLNYQLGQRTGEWNPSENPNQEVPYSPAYLLKTELAHLNPNFVGTLEILPAFAHPPSFRAGGLF